MRHVAALTPEKIPRDDQFKFKDRAQALVNKWHNTIQSNSGKVNGANGTADGMDVDKHNSDDAAKSAKGDENTAHVADSAGDLSGSAAGDLTMEAA